MQTEPGRGLMAVKNAMDDELNQLQHYLHKLQCSDDAGISRRQRQFRTISPFVAPTL